MHLISNFEFYKGCILDEKINKDCVLLKTMNLRMDINQGNMNSVRDEYCEETYSTLRGEYCEET